MAQLHNRISRKELKEKILIDPTPRITISFYCYFRVEEPELFRNQLYKELKALDVLGRIYLANEGINAQISVPKENFELLRSYLYSHWCEAQRPLVASVHSHNDRRPTRARPHHPRGVRPRLPPRAGTRRFR